MASSTGLVLPLVFKGATIGALELHGSQAGSFNEEDARLLQPFADAAAVAIENARLYEQAHLSATLTERNRLARELHDTIAQGLTAITMQLEAAQRSFDRDALRTRARLGRAHELARETLDNVRRSVWTLAAPLVDGQVLSEALNDLTQRFADRTGLPARYQHCGPSPTLGHCRRDPGSAPGAGGAAKCREARAGHAGRGGFAARRGWFLCPGARRWRWL